MPQAVFLTPDGAREEVAVTNGTSLMQAAIKRGIRSIVGDCGGAAACATCHVYVDEQYLDKLTPKDDNEREMLQDATSPVEDNSRLSCQILMKDQLDGITVRVAPTQW